MENMTLSASLEDYLEAIQEICGEGGVARMRDIAGRMRVRTPSATAAVRRLGRQGLVTHERYEYVELTERGKDCAQKVVKRHRMLKRFLREVLGVSEATSERDACQLEHVMSAETAEGLVSFMEFVEQEGEEGQSWKEWVKRRASEGVKAESEGSDLGANSAKGRDAE